MKKQIIYLDAIDTTRTMKKVPDYDKYELIGKAAIMYNLVNLRTPILSSSQCFDSKVIIDALKDENFRKLLGKGYIKTTWVDKKGKLTDALIAALSRGVYDDKGYFVFSGFDFLNDPNDDIKIDTRKMCKQWIEGGGKGELKIGPESDEWCASRQVDNEKNKMFVHAAQSQGSIFYAAKHL